MSAATHAVPAGPGARIAPAAAARPDDAPYRIHRYPSALIAPATLADGRRVIVRPVLPQDAEAEQTFFSALSPASRRRRFHGVVNRLPDGALQAMTSIDYERHVALVAEVRDEAPPLPARASAGPAPSRLDAEQAPSRLDTEQAPSRLDTEQAPSRLVADARYVIDDDGVAEFALAVADDWQGLGLGRTMLGLLARHARARGVARLDGSVLADNLPMLGLVQSLGGRVGPDPEDAALVHVHFGT